LLGKWNEVEGEESLFRGDVEQIPRCGVPCPIDLLVGSANPSHFPESPVALDEMLA